MTQHPVPEGTVGPRLWFAFDAPVDRRTYVLNGLLLAAIKYAGDVALVWFATRTLWLPSNYLSPSTAVTALSGSAAPSWLSIALALWTLPFLWVGVSMSMRRAFDAGISGWSALLFFLPYVNYAYMAVMAVLPSQRHASQVRSVRAAGTNRSAAVAIVAGMTVGLGMLAISVYGFAAYGAALFLGTPFLIGALTAFLLNRPNAIPGAQTQLIVALTMASVGAIALVTAGEGAVCLLMAAPIALAIGAMGASLGRRLAIRGDDSSPLGATMVMIALPLSASIDARRATTELREVRSAIVIDAKPMQVWPHVIAFRPLPPPTELVFRSGIAYPMRAEITGSGVGAVRRCVFSTGAFVEPITRWEPGARLSFDVAEQPQPMKEWSPYASITPPHLDGYFKSRRGEFRLSAMPDGRTRLEGSTWYEMRLYPSSYWALFGDALIARIHQRVLRHIRAEVEQA
jgi:uncharacterized membrane protein YhaH (DUF805 family)